MRPPQKLRRSAHDIEVDPQGEKLRDTTQNVAVERQRRAIEGSHSTEASAETMPPRLGQKEDVPANGGGTLHTVAPQEKSQIRSLREIRQEQATDAEWMRSRTSRLLGLVADDDNDNESTASKISRGVGTPLAVLEGTSSPEPAPPTEEQSLLHDDENSGDPLDIDDLEASSQAIRESGRLFLRNLSYTVKEDDLRKLFGSAEALQEVSQLILLSVPDTTFVI